MLGKKLDKVVAKAVDKKVSKAVAKNDKNDKKAEKKEIKVKCKALVNLRFDGLRYKAGSSVTLPLKDALAQQLSGSVLVLEKKYSKVPDQDVMVSVNPASLHGDSTAPPVINS